jgi:cephalosporin hydroxylase
MLQIKELLNFKNLSLTTANPVPLHGGKSFEVDMWAISKFILKKVIPVIGCHPYPLNELSLMVSTICWLKPTHIFEWGTHLGKSARVFYETITYFNLNTEIHSIDLPMDQEHVEHPKNKRGIYVKKLKRVNLHLGDGLNKSLEIYNSCNHITVPLFFLDGDHSYESVKRELNTISAKISNPNFLVHDTLFQSSESNYNIGPNQAVKEFLKNNSEKYLTMETSLGLPGMTLILKK